MTSEHFYLKWNSFQEDITRSYKNLRTDTHFSDVTLVCDEDQQIKAHRIILTSCSRLFSNILKKNPHPHPIIYMRGLKANDLVAIVDFIYLGEVRIYQNNLECFLALAHEIGLEGLSRKKVYFLDEKGKQTPDLATEMSETGSDISGDNIGRIDEKVQEHNSNNSNVKEDVALEVLPETSSIEIDYEDLETVLPLAEKIQTQSCSENVKAKIDNNFKCEETKEIEFTLPKDELELSGKGNDTVHEYTELQSNTNIHSSTEMKALDLEDGLNLSENNVESIDDTQQNIHENIDEQMKTNIPSSPDKQPMKTPKDILIAKNVLDTDDKIFLSADISKEELEIKIDALMEKVDSDNNIWLCTVCLRTNQGNNAMYAIKRHIETHFEGLAYPCEHCEHISRSRNALSNHKFTQHKQEEHLKRMKELENRQTFVSLRERKQVSCEICPYTCRKLSRLRSHTKIHTEEKKYICSICKLSFPRSKGLKKHSILHDTDDLINKEYIELDEKIESMMFIGKNRTEDGRRKATVCKMCGKEGYPSVIKKHMETNHLEVYFPCTICIRVFRARASLRIHTARVH